MIATYDELAEVYGQRADEHGASTRAAMEQLLYPHLLRGSRVLDIGCAVGIAVEVLEQAGYRATGIDNSQEMIRVARRDRSAGEFHQVDWLDLMTGGWDCIQAFAFLHLFPKDVVPRLLTKLRAELRPGGLLIAGTTLETESREGWEGKVDYPGAPQRWRARWTPVEVLGHWTQGWEIVGIYTHVTTVAANKTWLDLLLRRPED